MARSARNPTILATNEFECLFALLCQSHERASTALLHQHRTEGDEDESVLVQTFVQYAHYSLAVALSRTAYVSSIYIPLKDCPQPEGSYIHINYLIADYSNANDQVTQNRSLNRLEFPIINQDNIFQ
jgi:hypothetical protein